MVDLFEEKRSLLLGKRIPTGVCVCMRLFQQSVSSIVYLHGSYLYYLKRKFCSFVKPLLSSTRFLSRGLSFTWFSRTVWFFPPRCFRPYVNDQSTLIGSYYMLNFHRLRKSFSSAVITRFCHAYVYSIVCTVRLGKVSHGLNPRSYHQGLYMGSGNRSMFLSLHRTP